ncbi:DUF732 domain-containing protein [Antrihabitans spumae]|uniref:DUF732 domain-containing protein n=1 Tax=Antrihabitans spumae TaxID=3373370 RepID=A0ABW7K3L6_9NOCA
MNANRIKSIVRTSSVAAFITLAALGTAGVANAAPSLTADDRDFLALLEGEGIDIGSDSKAINLGHHICESFDDGYSFETVAQEGRDQSDLTDYEIGYTIGAAVYAYCPSNLDVIPV